MRQVVAYRSLAELERSGVRVVRTLPELRTAVVESKGRVGAQPVLRRALTVDEPALAETYQPGVAWEWQWKASRMDEVPEWVLRAAASVKIAVVDSGADRAFERALALPFHTSLSESELDRVAHVLARELRA